MKNLFIFVTLNLICLSGFAVETIEMLENRQGLYTPAPAYEIETQRIAYQDLYREKLSRLQSVLNTIEQAELHGNRAEAIRASKQRHMLTLELLRLAKRIRK